MPLSSIYSRVAFLAGFGKDYDGSGRTYIADGEHEIPGVYCTGVYNRTIGFDHVETFREGFNWRYNNWTELLDLIIRR